MRVWHECSRCQLPASLIAAAAQRMLARARCIRVDSANGIVDVYSACSEAPLTTPGVWKAVSTVDAADQERWHRLLDYCAHKVLECMISELNKAWDRGLQHFDVIKQGLQEYMHLYMQCWDAADMNEAQRAQLRPSVAAAIQGITQLPHDL
jgi:hypothetical protein